MVAHRRLACQRFKSALRTLCELSLANLTPNSESCELGFTNAVAPPRLARPCRLARILEDIGNGLVDETQPTNTRRKQ